MLVLVNPTSDTWKQIRKREARGRKLMRMRKADLLILSDKLGIGMLPEASKGEIVEEILFKESGF